MRYILSDTHFFHTKLLESQRDMFSDTDAMNDFIEETWCDTITKDDRVYHLGDFAFGDNFDAIEQLIQRLPGKVTLILGNHDSPKKVALYSKYWKVVGAAYVDGLVLSHAPVHPYLLGEERLVDGINTKILGCVHGHMHHVSLGDPRYFNANWDVLRDKKILTLQEIKQHMLNMREKANDKEAI